MTKEEIRAKAVDNADKRIKEVDKNSLSAIADYDRGLIQGFDDGAEWMREKMIEKAADWIENMVIDYFQGDVTHIFTHEMIGDFRKAMQDESK